MITKFNLYRKYIISWFFLIASFYFMNGLDAISRLKQGGWLGRYTEAGIRIHSVSAKGLPEWLYTVMLVLLVMPVFYIHLEGLVIKGWKEKSLFRRVVSILFFIINGALGVVVYIWLALDYALGTSIDSL